MKWTRDNEGYRSECGQIEYEVETVPGHQSACFADERQEKRGLK